MNALSANRKWKNAGIELYVILFFLFVLWGCGTSNETNHNPMSVDIDVRHDVSIFDIFERIELIPLETTDESIFRYISKLIYHDGVLYVLDGIGRKIFAFDSAGKFLFKIDDRGQGPEEYLHIADFEIDRQRNVMLILDPVSNSLFEYNLNGRFLHRQRLPTIIGAYGWLRYLGDNIIAFWTFDDNNRLKFYNRSQGSIFSEHLPLQERNMFDLFSAGVFPNSNLLMRDAALNNNIYEVFPDGTYSIAYTWDFGRLNNSVAMTRNFPDIPRSQEEWEAVERRRRNSEFVNYFFTNIGGNQTYRYAQIVRRNQNINLLHNISERQTRVFMEFSEGVAFFPIFWSDEFVIGHGPFAGYGDETVPDVILDDRNLEIKRNICEFDNPVLIKYFFRR